MSLLKFVKKFGRYNRKIGISIGGSDSRNFAHHWVKWMMVLVTWKLQPAEFYIQFRRAAENTGLATSILCSAACTAHHNAQQISKLGLPPIIARQNVASFSAKSSHHGKRNFSLKLINKPRPIHKRKIDTEKVPFRLKSGLFELKSRLFGPTEWLFGPKTYLFSVHTFS